MTIGIIDEVSGRINPDIFSDQFLKDNHKKEFTELKKSGSEQLLISFG